MLLTYLASASVQCDPFYLFYCQSEHFPFCFQCSPLMFLQVFFFSLSMLCQSKRIFGRLVFSMLRTCSIDTSNSSFFLFYHLWPMYFDDLYESSFNFDSIILLVFQVSLPYKRTALTLLLYSLIFVFVLLPPAFQMLSSLLTLLLLCLSVSLLQFHATIFRYCAHKIAEVITFIL